MLHVRGLRIFFREGAPNFVTFSSVVFPAELVLSILSTVTKTTLGGSGGTLPRKFFEYLHAVMAVLVLFEQFLGKVSSYFWPITLSASPNMMHFVRTVSSMRA